MGPLEHLSGFELVLRKSVAENKQKMMMHGDRKGRDAMMTRRQVHHKNLHQYWVGTDSITLMLSPRTLSERDAVRCIDITRVLITIVIVVV